MISWTVAYVAPFFSSRSFHFTDLVLDHDVGDAACRHWISSPIASGGGISGDVADRGEVVDFGVGFQNKTMPENVAAWLDQVARGPIG